MHLTGIIVLCAGMNPSRCWKRCVRRMEKKAYEKGDKSSMNQKKIILLESIGFVWAKEKGNIAWGNSFEELMAYKKEHGHSK